MSMLEKLGDTFREASKTLAKGREMCVMSAERRMRTERLKINIRDLREEKDKLMLKLAHAVYERYAQGVLQDQELLAACQEIKMLQWQIDERWSEINAIAKEDEQDDEDL